MGDDKTTYFFVILQVNEPRDEGQTSSVSVNAHISLTCCHLSYRCTFVGYLCLWSKCSLAHLLFLSSLSCMHTHHNVITSLSAWSLIPARPSISSLSNLLSFFLLLVGEIYTFSSFCPPPSQPSFRSTSSDRHYLRLIDFLELISGHEYCLSGFESIASSRPFLIYLVTFRSLWPHNLCSHSSFRDVTRQ